MKFFSMLGSSVFQILSFLFVLAYFLGILNLHFSYKSNYCVMTYMFEYPQFVRITLEDNQLYPQYGLYAYSEGRFTERARKMWFDGIPVLFLPGNSGSYMQARSLASVALRKAISKGYEYHFDFFTINYNEELSGLYGGVLQSQTRFAGACISKILSVYKMNKYTKNTPTSVILIGHSMGGLIAKRLLAYPSTINTTNIAITLAAPLEAPVMNFDVSLNDYYKLINLEWEANVNSKPTVKEKKILISIGSGARDVLVPAGLTSSNDSAINVLTTAIPGVWVTPDHVSMVWCKQLVMTINRYLFDIVDPWTDQITEDGSKLTSKALQYFKANRSMTLDSAIRRPNVTMQVDSFWYEDNRRIYQISRPEINKTTYLMIRLVSFPQNRFVAVEAVNVDDKDWLFGCNAKDIHHTYRYCKQATSLSELSRWTGVATDFGRRKLATIHLHSIMDQYPEWTHVIVKVSPTRKPVVLNVDVNDLTSRQINVAIPSELSFGKHIIKQETEQNSLYLELILTDFNVVHQAFLLYIEPTASCQAMQYHVSAEVHVPWAPNHEYYHYITHLKRSPMKVHLHKSNPNITLGLEPMEKVKITILLDPQCTFTISISASWYHRLAQLARNYTPVLVPYVAAIVLLATRSNILHFKRTGTFVSTHIALMSEGVKPYYCLVFARLATVFLMTVPMLSFVFENASWNNLELQYFTRSLLVLPVYMTALGITNIAAAAILLAMVFSSQIAHRLLFRIVWRGGSSFAEKMASGLQKVPLIVSATLVCAAPLSCGAASLTAGAAFYAFMISKMYEEYLEDYAYKLLAKIGSKVCHIFKAKKANNESNSSLILLTDSPSEPTTSQNLLVIDSKIQTNTNLVQDDTDTVTTNSETKDESKSVVVKETETDKKCAQGDKKTYIDHNADEDLNNLHFHMMLFLMWMCVTIVNIPALLTWARNFKYSMVLKPDTSYHTGLVMSACSSFVWQANGPRQNLRHYDAVSSLLFTMAVFMLALGPLSLSIVNYGVTFMFVVIVLQQLFDKEETDDTTDLLDNKDNKTDLNTENEDDKRQGDDKSNDKDSTSSDDNPKSDEKQDDAQSNQNKTSEECVCDESRIYNLIKNLREKFNFTDESIS